MRFLNTALGVANDIDGPTYRCIDPILYALFLCCGTRCGGRRVRAAKTYTEAHKRAEAAWFVAYNEASAGEEVLP